MSDTDCEIECLDEDADIVQQCVQSQSTETSLLQPVYVSNANHLVERGADRKRRRIKKYAETDSDYNPNDEPEPPKRARKRTTPVVPIKKATKITQSVSSNVVRKAPTPRIINRSPFNEYKIRKKMDICIPDYDDPLCLPVRAMKKPGSDVQRLKNWNNVCLEHFKHCNSILRPEQGVTKSSTRNIVLRNVVHRETGKQELAIWSKTCVENKEGLKKSEIFQSILPKFRERKMLSPFKLQLQRKESKFHHVSEVVLTKEEHKGEEVLVTYKPKEKLAAVYKYSDRITKAQSDNVEDEPKKCLKETALSKMCAPCYQTSWRGSKNTDQKGIQCPICRRASVSVYNLLTHLKAHQPVQVRKYKRAIAMALSKVVDYHYRCRVCLEQFLSIKALRDHVKTHRGTELFKCEVGNHMTK